MSMQWAKGLDTNLHTGKNRENGELRRMRSSVTPNANASKGFTFVRTGT